MRAKWAEFFGRKKLALVPLLFAVSIQTFSSKYIEQEIKDYQLKFQGRSPIFKDFSRTNSFSRTFQGKPEIQGLFKDCGNPVFNGISYFRASPKIKKLEFYRAEVPFWNDLVMQNTCRKAVLGAINLLLGLWSTYHENIWGQLWT